MYQSIGGISLFYTETDNAKKGANTTDTTVHWYIPTLKPVKQLPHVMNSYEIVYIDS